MWGASQPGLSPRRLHMTLSAASKKRQRARLSRRLLNWLIVGREKLEKLMWPQGRDGSASGMVDAVVGNQPFPTPVTRVYAATACFAVTSTPTCFDHKNHAAAISF